MHAVTIAHGRRFSRETLAQRGVRLASARGVNARAVSEHVVALILALERHVHDGVDAAPDQATGLHALGG